MQEFINIFSPHLEYVSIHSSADCIVFEVRSKTEHSVCPYCGVPSHRCHSRYRKSFQGLPVHVRNVMIEMTNRKMFFDNPDCSHRTFAETFEFIERSQKNTKRLIYHITDTANHMSSVSV